VNVKDFGAKGDGVTDDTQAVQAAINAAFAARGGGRWGEHGAYFGNVPEVLFPAGRYKLTDTINLVVPFLRGEGDPSIELANPDKDIFFTTYMWHGVIAGITFLGGRTALSLGNPNLDTGHVTIEKCKFYHTSGPAVHFRKGSNSTFLIIKDCVIRDCRQALVTYTDWTTVRDCWISSDAEMDHMAVIENRGAYMTLDNMLGVPRCTGVDQRWVDNYNNLTAVQCRFGGEGGGFTPVVNFAKFNPQAGANWIVLDGCWISSQSNYKRKCAVYCEEIPNGIELRNCSIDGVPVVKVDKKIDLNTYFTAARPGMLKYAVTNCYGEYGDIPQQMKKPAMQKGLGVPQLSAKETKNALAKAVTAVKAAQWPAASPMTFAGHTEQTDPTKYLDITAAKYPWDLTDFMDATRQPNGEYLSVAQAGDDIVIMRRIEANHGWPHMLIKNISVDLDKYPYLTWKIRDAVNGTPNSHAIRVIDSDAERMVSICEAGHGAEYQAYNVKEKLGLSGVRQLQIRFYFLGHRYIPPTKTEPFSFVHAKPGEYIVLDYLRFEAK
jgi:hypothetical protein